MSWFNEPSSSKIQPSKKFPRLSFAFQINPLLSSSPPLLLLFLMNQHNNQLPVDLLAQLVEHSSSITDVKGSNPTQA